MKLDAYLKNKGIKVADFARNVGKTRGTIYAYIGETKEPSLSACREIEVATLGEVRAQDFYKLPLPDFSNNSNRAEVPE